MKVKLSEIMEAIDFETEDSRSLLNKKTGKIVSFRDEYFNAAEEDEDLSDYQDWELKEIKEAKKYLKKPDDYIDLPTEFDFNEYRVMENFIVDIPNDKQKEILFEAIRGKGAFSKFRQGVERFGLLEKWYEYSNNALTDFAKNWCQENQIEFE